MAQRPGNVRLCTEAPKGMCDILKRVTLRGKDSLPGSEIDRGGCIPGYWRMLSCLLKSMAPHRLVWVSADLLS